MEKWAHVQTNACQGPAGCAGRVSGTGGTPAKDKFSAALQCFVLAARELFYGITGHEHVGLDGSLLGFQHYGKNLKPLFPRAGAFPLVLADKRSSFQQGERDKKLHESIGDKNTRKSNIHH